MNEVANYSRALTDASFRKHKLDDAAYQKMVARNVLVLYFVVVGCWAGYYLTIGRSLTNLGGMVLPLVLCT